MRINPAHRYLIRDNRTRKFVGSTDDLDMARQMDARELVDTVGEDGLGPGIAQFLKENDRG